MILYGLERIAIIEFVGSDENHSLNTKKLIIELMGKYSNIILVDEKYEILDSLKHFSTASNSQRNIMPKEKYTFPETSNKIDITEASKLEKDFNNLDKNDAISFFVNNFIGFSKTLVQNAFNSFLQEELSYNKLVNYFLNLKEKINLNMAKCMAIENDYTVIACEEKEALQMNFFLDDYLFNKEQLEQFNNYRNTMLSFISGKAKKISKKLDTVEEKIKECSHMEEYKLYGELITNYLYKIPKEHLPQIELENYYKNNEKITIPLDITLSPTDNAKKYFKKYHKLKNTILVVNEQKSDLEKEINYLESIIYEIQSAQTISELDFVYDEIQNTAFSHSHTSKSSKLKKKKSKSVQNTEPLLYMCQGFKILVGRNNQENDKLTFKIAHKDDIWLHVKDLHGSHVILQTNGKIPPQEVINKCASIAAYYSKGKQSSNVAVDYTFVKYVKKPNKAKPGMVIYTDYKTVQVQPNLIF